MGRAPRKRPACRPLDIKRSRGYHPGQWVGVVLGFLGGVSSMAQDLYSELLGIPPGPRPPNHYQLLGLRTFESDTHAIHEAVLRQTARLKRWELHPDPEFARRVQEMLNEVNGAGAILQDHATKEPYDVELAWTLGVPLSALEAPAAEKRPQVPLRRRPSPEAPHPLRLEEEAEAAEPAPEPPPAPPRAAPEPTGPSLRAAAADLLRRRWAWGLLAAALILAIWLPFALRRPAPEPQSPPKLPPPPTPAHKEEGTIKPRVGSRDLVSTVIKAAEPEPPKAEPTAPTPAQAAAAAYPAFKLGVEKLEKESRYGDAMSACTQFMKAHSSTREAEAALAVLNDLRKKLDSIRDDHAGRFKRAVEKGDLKRARDVIAELARYKAGEVSEDLDHMRSQATATEKRFTQWPFDEVTAKWRQRIAAEAHRLAIEMDVDLGDGVKMTLVLIPPGSFVMGSDPGARTPQAEQPAHKVTFAKPFYMGKHEVTQRQWEALMRGNPSKFKHADRPVECVSWDDCRGFLTQLNKRTGRTFALPSESEWEYACRAGASTAYCFGNKEADLPDFAWFVHNSGNTTHPVGTRKPNAWGLHDMHGNVWEWCEDVWHTTYDDAPKDGSAWCTGGVQARRASRGGSWNFVPDSCRAAFRGGAYATARSYFAGCRIVLREL
ncbi:MAG: formylglycine-generating enzyme family protein [Planctomycetes bacterium]|nr:formylglycine-generating enzyme family protein [Planctomycetota bacterium]